MTLPRRQVLVAATTALLASAATPASAATRPGDVARVDRVDPKAVVEKFKRARPASWGTALPGILTTAPKTHVTVKGKRQPVACLTFDACGNPTSGSSGYDAELVDFLRANKVPATLFISRQWALKNPKTAAALARDPLFEVVNHGTYHLPISVNGRAAYDIKGTTSAAAAVSEVWDNTLHLATLRGSRPTLFRSGTAHYDDPGVAIVRALGQLPVGFSTNIDYGATAKASVVSSQLRSMKPGGIALGHFNRPGGQTFEGVRDAVPRMRNAGWVFSRVSDAL